MVFLVEAVCGCVSGLWVRKGGAGGRGCSEDGLLGGLCETVYVFFRPFGWMVLAS